MEWGFNPIYLDYHCIRPTTSAVDILYFEDRMSDFGDQWKSFSEHKQSVSIKYLGFTIMIHPVGVSADFTLYGKYNLVNDSIYY